MGEWTLSDVGPNTLSATVAGVAPVTFTATAFDPWFYIVSDSAPECPVGGPIYRVNGSEITPLAQGGLLEKPRGMVLDGQGNLIVADGLAGLMRVSLSTGAVSLIAYGPPYSPRDVAIDASGDYIAVEQPTGSGAQAVGLAAVYRVTPGGQVTVVAQGAPFNDPHGLALDAQGNYIVSDGSAGIFRVTAQGAVTQVVAAGPPPAAIGSGVDVAVDAAGNYIVADAGRGALHRVTPAGTVTLIHQAPPFSVVSVPGESARGPRGVVVDENGDYVVVDWNARAVFRVRPNGQVSTTYQGGPLCGPADLTLEPRSP